MNLEDVYNQLEELQNNLEYYENRLEEIKSLVTPQATQFDKIMVDGGKHVDNILKYVEIENKQQLETTILYIKGRMRDLNILKDKEIDRLAKFGEKYKAVVLLREREFKTVYNNAIPKKRHLNWNEIGERLYCDERTARRWYKLAIQERKRVLS